MIYKIKISAVRFTKKEKMKDEENEQIGSKRKTPRRLLHRFFLCSTFFYEHADNKNVTE